MSDHAQQRLQHLLEEAVADLPCPGAAVGVWADGEELVAVHGVTSVENPLEVDEDTLFQIGSTTKPFTATAALALAERGRLDLDAPVRDLIPDFTVRDQVAARTVTVRQLTNHTAGWAGDFLGVAADEGDGALRRYVQAMADLPQEFPVGTATSYNNASFALLGRIVEVVTGQRFEDAMRELVLDPLGMGMTFLHPAEVMTRRFAVGHSAGPDGGFRVSRPWRIPRGSTPAGGITSTVRDQLRWVGWQLAGVDGPVGERVRRSMWEPTAALPVGNAAADHVGVAWMLKDLGEGRTKVAHGGATIGQVSALELLPGQRFGVTVLTNASCALSRVLARRVLEELAGVSWADPQGTDREPESLRGYAGAFDGSGYRVVVAVDGESLLLTHTLRPEVLAQLGITEPPADPPPMPASMVGAQGDVFVVTGGPAQGATGGFTRDRTGRITHMNLGGRLCFPVGKEH